MRDISVDLAKARRLFDEMRFVPAYSAYQRAFNQLPFRPEPAYALHIGTFIKVLLAVGRRDEVVFYHRQLEQSHDRYGNSVTALQLVSTSIYLEPPQWHRAKMLLEGILRDKDAADLHLRARILMALFYDSVEPDISVCRELIFNSQPTAQEDPVNLEVLQIWRAKILKEEGNVVGAKRILRLLLKQSRSLHWYSLFSARVVLANLLLRDGEIEKARTIVAGLKRYFRGRAFRIIQYQMDAIERVLGEATSIAQACEGSQNGTRGSRFLPERDKLRRMNPVHFLRVHGWISQATLIHNLA